MSSSEVYAPRRDLRAVVERRRGEGHDVRVQPFGNGHPGSPRVFAAVCRCGWRSDDGSSGWANWTAMCHLAGLSNVELQATQEGLGLTLQQLREVFRDVR